jgi:hypothetical protein
MATTLIMRLPSAARGEGGLRFNYRGMHRYFITQPVHSSFPGFDDPAKIFAVLEVLRSCAAKQKFDVYAYLFLPAKLILIIRGKGEESDMKAFLSEFRENSTAVMKLPAEGALWSRKYVERVLRKSELSREAVKDVLMIPVKEGLAASPGEYRFGGSFAYDPAKIFSTPKPSYLQRKQFGADRRGGKPPSRPYRKP